jgi:uncharacterized membrane protein
MTIESNRTLGGIGALLTLTGVVSTILTIIESGNPASTNFAVLGVSSIIGFLTFIGFILFLVAMHGFSRDYAEHRIFRYILYGFLAALVSAIVIAVIWVSFTIVNVFSAISNNPSVPANSSAIQTLLAPYLSPLGAAFSVVALVYALFNYKAYNLLADKSGVRLFGSAAKILVLGAIVNIAVEVTFAVLGFTGSIDLTTLALAAVPGGLIQYLAWAFVAKGFFSIKAPAIQTTTQQTAPTMTTPSAKYCPGCGAKNQTDSTYCVRCGKKLEP